MNDVKFAGGLLGHLEKGGQFSVKRAEIAPGVWELTDLAVSMRGKALLFKTISVQQKELHSEFQRVPNNLTLSEAAGLLLQRAPFTGKLSSSRHDNSLCQQRSVLAALQHNFGKTWSTSERQ
jgi:hypothetical protein